MGRQNRRMAQPRAIPCGHEGTQTLRWHSKQILDPREVAPRYGGTRWLLHHEMLSRGIYVARAVHELSIRISEDDVDAAEPE